MANEDKGGADDIDLEDLPGDVAAGEEDKTDWKALAIKNHGTAKRFQTKLSKLKDGNQQQNQNGNGQNNNQNQNQNQDASKLDKGDHAILRAEGIKSTDELALVERIMKETGKDVLGTLDSKYFQSELKEMRDLAATKDATPDGRGRSGQSSRDTVDYWIQKGELPKDNPELARKVVAAKIAKEKSASQFSKTPIV